ncbi:MAG TPA: hypothetical protein ENJ00_02855 [Phycisphaerales bacterium]|nr:hypothetical protein [Phycisphaerales bacterium]
MRTQRNTIYGLVAFLVLSTTASGQVVNHQLTELANGLSGVVGERFGSAVAVGPAGSGMVAVGVPFEDFAGNADSGKVHVFVLSGTGSIIQATSFGVSDNAANDQFGSAIAFGGQGRIAVGAPFDDDHGSNSGSVYVYDALTGGNLLKFTSEPFAAGGDTFGASVAYDEATSRLVAGAPSFDAVGTNSGAAYILDSVTGSVLHSLTPVDAASFDDFGRSIALDSGVCVIGAPKDDDNGPNSGSVYLYDVTTGNQLLKITPSDGTAGDEFGGSVSVSEGIVAVGASHEDENGFFSGAVYLFDAATGTQLYKLISDNPASSALFGEHVVIHHGVVAVTAPGEQANGFNSGSSYYFNAATGALVAKNLPLSGGVGDSFGGALAVGDDFVVVGAPLDDDFGSDYGSAYVFRASSSPQLAKLLCLDGMPEVDFGAAVAIDGGIAVVGAPRSSPGSLNQGVIGLFDVATGNQITMTFPSDSNQGDRFGTSVDVDSGVIVVGSPFNDENGPNSGSAYVMDSTGFITDKLLASDGSQADAFGTSVAIRGTTIAVGAPGDDDSGLGSGSVYLFDAATAAQTFKLVPADGAAGDEFGNAVAVGDSVVVVGAKGDDTQGDFTGAAYVFDRNTGAQLLKLVASDGQAFDRFGHDVDVANGVVAVGAFGSNVNGFDSGAVYLFDQATGVQLAKVTPSDGLAFDQFGASIALTADTLAVGALTDDNEFGIDAGSVYFFTVPGGGEIARYNSNDASASDLFGAAVAMDTVSGTALIGASGDADFGSFSGSAYLFEQPIFVCTADVNGDGMLTPSDFTAWIAAFNASAPGCDQNSDGNCDPSDFTAWIVNFNAGCP